MELKKTISRSYSRKLNLATYGGPQYENIDFFSSYSEEVISETSQEELKRISQLLYDMARADVEEEVEKTIKSLKPKSDLAEAVKLANEIAKENHE